ncbi:MAG: carbohydrate kinase family protein [Gemmatimonadaceae bacterium]
MTPSHSARAGAPPRVPAVSSGEVLCVGEVLWDSLPEGLFLGGAPFNVACHLRATGTAVSMVSRVGNDRLGDEVLRRAARYGVGTDLVQIDDGLPTGFVRVHVDERGNGSYEICEPVAWDAIEATEALLARTAAARAIVFGSLAQRNATTRATLERLWRVAARDALMVFDVNLRPPFEDVESVRASLATANVVKLSDAELVRLCEWFGWEDSNQRAMMRGLARQFDCAVVCVTRGSQGAALLHDGEYTEHPGFPAEVRDTVGAGDAFLAVLLAGLLAGSSDAELLQHANLMGAYVVTQFGALPADQGAAIAPPDASSPPPRPRPRQVKRRGR